jgi:hypothetical protein|tara:strand:+ start:263 stop:724 length:462 start_codon:yes stop_codon:yes gene_type:complete
MITTIAVSVAITAIILLILFIGMMSLSQSVAMQDNKAMLIRLTTLTDKYSTDQQQITKILSELTLQLHQFSVAVDEVVSSIYDTATKFPPDMDMRDREFSVEDLEKFTKESLNKSRLNLDRYDIKHLKDLFMDIDKMSENDYNSEEEDPELDD